MGGEGNAVIQQALCCSLQTCSDRLHMPGNLEFISPPFLISAPVIQINSNEISRGKAPFGWGVCSSPQLSPILWTFPRVKAEQLPPLPPSQRTPTSTCGGVNLRCCHSQTLSLSPEKNLNSSQGLRGDSPSIHELPPNTCSLSGHPTKPARER